MRSLLTRLLPVPALLLVLCGCPAAPEGTAPGAALTMTGPRTPVELLHGLDQTVDVTVNWKATDREPVELSAKVEPQDKGVTVRAGEPIKPDASTGKVTVSASETAVSGTYKVTVVGKTAKHGEASTTFEVRVPQKD